MENDNEVVGLSFREVIFRPFFRPFIKKMANITNQEKFENSPAVFFENLSSDAYRRVGLVFFGKAAPLAGNASSQEVLGKNVLADYKYYENGPLGPKFKLREKIRPGYGVLLVERDNATMADELSIYKMLEENKNNLYSLRHRHLHRIRFFDEARQSSYLSVGRTKVIDRLGPKGREVVSRFAFIICVNPTTEFVMGLRSLGSNSRLIVIYTQDFSLDNIREKISEIDILISPAVHLNSYPCTRIRRHEVGGEAEHIYAILESIIEELMPRDKEAYIQLKGEKSYIPRLIDKNTKQAQVVMFLCVSEDEAPIVSATFEKYLRVLAESVDKLFVSESIYFSYKSLLIDPEKDLFDFMSAALLDGIRFETHFSETNNLLVE